MKVRLLVLTSLIATAGLIDSAMAMEKNHTTVNENFENENFQEDMTPIPIKNSAIKMFNLKRSVTLSKYEHTVYYENKEFDLKQLEEKLAKDHYDKVLQLLNHSKYITRLLTDKEEKAVSGYLKNWLTQYFKKDNLASGAWYFGNELAHIKNLHIRRIFAHELVKHLRSIITVSTAGNVADQFDDIKEGLAKWAIRFIYNEVMTGTKTPFIDNMDVVRQINKKIAQERKIISQKPDDFECSLDLRDLNNRQQLENFLLQAHEILEPLFGYDITLLCLDRNQLTQLPDFNLPNLQWLSLYENSLTQVPNFNLPNLQWLHLHENSLTQVPNFNLPNLKELDLANNQLTQVPNFNLTNLQWLSLNDNRLTQVPDFNLPNLKWLKLSNNRLNKKPVFTNLPKNCDIRY